MNFFIYIIVGFVLLDILIVFLVVFIKKRKKFSDKDLHFIKINWFRILDLVSTDPIRAIMDADKLLDFALGKRGKTGSLGEKLKQSKSLFKDINSVWEVHKLRNKLAHEFRNLSVNEAKNALKHYKNALKDLGINI